jgi:Protein of unknown function (DUF3348)
MEPAFLRPTTASATGLPGPGLVGVLAQLGLQPGRRPGPAPAGAASPSFVQGLAGWLGWKDAIALAAALQAPPTAAVSSGATRSRAGAKPSPLRAAAEQAFERVAAPLRQAIDDDRDTAGLDGSDFLPFRSRCFALQQAMSRAVGPLRVQLRGAVARGSPALAQLAALDAVMAEALAAREQAQLAQLPTLLDQHFHQLRAQHLRQALAQASPGTQDTLSPGTPSPNPGPAAWIDTFRHDMRRLLRAELALRLQPCQGLLDTLRSAQPETS